MQSVSNSHIFFASPNPITSPIKMSPLCENGEDEDDDVALAVKTVTAIPLIIATPLASPAKEVESVEMMVVAVEPSVIPGIIETVAESEIESVAVCPTTPSRANFKAAFSVIKSAKKSPFLSKATPSKTPCDEVVVVENEMAVRCNEEMEVQANLTDSVTHNDVVQEIPETATVTEVRICYILYR